MRRKERRKSEKDKKEGGRGCGEKKGNERGKKIREWWKGKVNDKRGKRTRKKIMRGIEGKERKGE